jgi:hypothetical protein
VEALFLLWFEFDRSPALNAELCMREKIFPAARALLKNQEWMSALRAEFCILRGRLVTVGAL